MVAVAAGSSPITTAPCAAGNSFSASAEQSGNPTTTPAATTASPGQSRRGGNRSRRASSSAAASPAATNARPSPTTVPPNSGTAARVAGKVKLKASMPSKPQVSPCVARSRPLERHVSRIPPLPAPPLAWIVKSAPS